MMIYLFLIIGVIAVDQVLKHVLEALLITVSSVTLIPGVLELHLIYNDGAAFSLFAGKQLFLILLTAAAIAAMTVYLFLGKGLSVLEKFAFALIIGGGIGNLIDRVLNQQVVDYIRTLFIDFPVFNFADICVCTGVGLFMISVLISQKDDQKS